jgi:hypothetical protein
VRFVKTGKWVAGRGRCLLWNAFHYFLPLFRSFAMTSRSSRSAVESGEAAAPPEFDRGWVGSATKPTTPTAHALVRSVVLV